MLPLSSSSLHTTCYTWGDNFWNLRARACGAVIEILARNARGSEINLVSPVFSALRVNAGLYSTELQLNPIIYHFSISQFVCLRLCREVLFIIMMIEICATQCLSNIWCVYNVVQMPPEYNLYNRQLLQSQGTLA